MKTSYDYWLEQKTLEEYLKKKVDKVDV